MGVVHQTRSGVGIVEEAQWCRVTRQGHRARRTWRRHAHPVLGLLRRDAGRPVQYVGQPFDDWLALARYEGTRYEQHPERTRDEQTEPATYEEADQHRHERKTNGATAQGRKAEHYSARGTSGESHRRGTCDRSHDLFRWRIGRRDGERRRLRWGIYRRTEWCRRRRLTK